MTLDYLRFQIRLDMGRKCDLPLDKCPGCRHRLRDMEAALAAIDLAEAARRAYLEGRTSKMRKALETFETKLAEAT